ncbi:unnamed protein product, partial [Dicrocoelium dendriticum]
MHAIRSLKTDASQFTVQAVLQQLLGKEIQPLSYLTRQLQPPQTRYGNFGPKRLELYSVFEHSRRAFEERRLLSLADYKTLVYSFRLSSDLYSFRELAQSTSFKAVPIFDTLT